MTLTPLRRRARLLASAGLAVGAGVAWAGAAQPRGWWALFPVGVAALAIALRGRRLRVRAALGVLAGVALYVPTLFWLTDFSVAGYVAVVLLQVVLLALVAVAVPEKGTAGRASGWWALPAALVLLEAVQARFPFGGFPLPALGHSQVGGPFMSAAPLGGSLLVTGAAAAAGLALAALLVPARRRMAVAGAAVVVAVLPVAAGSLVSTAAAGDLDVVAVQGGGPRGLRAIFTDSAVVTERHLETAEQIDGSPDLVLLPENVADVDGSISSSPLDARLAAVARRLDTDLVVGITEGDGERFWNAAVLWGRDGRRLDRYVKEHRVPFGEYIPARALFESLSTDTRFVPRDAVAGDGQALLSTSTTPLGVVISYEVFFAERVAEAVKAGGEVILVPTNASSYVTDEVPALEVAASRMRATEFGRTVVQAAPTGYSAIIHPNGDVVAVSELGAEARLHEVVPLRSGLTPYAHIGDAPVALLAALTLLTSARRFVKERWPLR